jgi:hypothetical protein
VITSGFEKIGDNIIRRNFDASDRSNKNKKKYKAVCRKRT